MSSGDEDVTVRSRPRVKEDKDKSELSRVKDDDQDATVGEVQDDERIKGGTKLLTRESHTSEILNDGLPESPRPENESPKTPSRTPAEREKEYAEARARIFDDVSDTPKSASWASEALKSASSQNTESSGLLPLKNAFAKGPASEGIGFTTARTSAKTLTAPPADNTTTHDDSTHDESKNDEKNKNNYQEHRENRLTHSSSHTTNNNHHHQTNNNNSFHKSNSGIHHQRGSYYRGDRRRHHNYQQQGAGSDTQRAHQFNYYQQQQQQQQQHMNFYSRPPFNPRPPMPYYQYSSDFYGQPMLYDQQQQHHHLNYAYPGMIYTHLPQDNFNQQVPRRGRPPLSHYTPPTVPLLPYPTLPPPGQSLSPQPPAGLISGQHPIYGQQHSIVQNQETHNGTPLHTNKQHQVPTLQKAPPQPHSSAPRSTNRRGTRSTAPRNSTHNERSPNSRHQQQQQESHQQQSVLPQRTYEEEFPSLGS